jgi:hypothetical protein
MRNFNGDIKFINQSGSGDIGIDINSGQITLDSTMVGTGLITIRGIAVLIDNSSANVVSSLFNGFNVYERIRTEMDNNSTQLEKIVRLSDELHRINGLDALNPTTVSKVNRKSGDIEQDFTTDANGNIKIQRT